MSDEPLRSPSLAQVQQRHARAALDGVHTMMPARVVRWDAAKQQADVQPLVQVAYEDEDGERQVATLPVIKNVPVAFPFGGGYRLTFPIHASDTDGDLGELRFAECSLDRWLSGSGGVVDPEIDVRFSLTDAIFTPGLHTFGAPLANVPTDHATLGLDGADDGNHVKIHLRAGTICLGDESGNDFLALAQAVGSQLSSLRDAILAWTPVANDGGAALKTALSTFFTGPPAWPGSVAASQAKGK